MKKIFFALIFISALAFAAQAQLIDKITRVCPSPNGNVFASILVNGNGDITHTPCPSKSTIFTGLVDFSGATVSGGGIITGTGTVNFVPRFGASNILNNTPLSWDNTTYIFNNTSSNATFRTEITPSSTVGKFFAGVSGGTQLEANQQFGYVRMIADGTTSMTMNAGGISFFNSPLSLLINTGSLKFTRTIIAAGTTGNQTINQMNGAVNFAAGANALTVTNSTVTNGSLIIATAQANDATCAVKNVVAAAGSFVINMTANCTAETRVAFWVTN